MKNLALILIITLGFLNFGFSQEQEVTSSLLWEISGKKVKSPSYIMGTMHMIPKEDFYFPEALQERVAKSDMLVMEIGGLSEQMKGMKLMMLESGNLFDDYFSKEQLDTLFAYTTEKMNMSEEKLRSNFSGMKPFVLTQILSKDMFGENPESYEMSLEKLAKENNLVIAGLETVEEQMGFINSLGANDQVEMVMSTIRNADATAEEGGNNMRKLIDLYLEQDIDKLHEYMSSSSLNSDDFENTMLNNRNKKWIKPIKKIIKKNKAFIAVGAGHLGGENGVLELLRKEGYTLTPIEF